MRWSSFSIVTIWLTVVACQDLNQALPAGTVDPETFRTVDGALSMYRGALSQGRSGFVYTFSQVSQFTDESRDYEIDVSLGIGKTPEALWARNPSENDLYSIFRDLNSVRHSMQQSRGFLQLFPDDISPVLQAELLALEGFSILYLGELFCSGVPLSTIDFEGDFNYALGSSTEELFYKAIALFDSSSKVAADSARILHLADVGAARALLNLGLFKEAAQRARAVKTGFRYGLPFYAGASTTPQGAPVGPIVEVGNRKGVNGLDYRSSEDPRVGSRFYRLSAGGDSIFVATKYLAGTTALMVLASDIEAKLIIAEALLRENKAEWLSLLNDLRTDNTFSVDAGGDTIWNSGQGGVAGLKPLADPALGPLPVGKNAFDVQVDLLFRERAFWLFFDGHRQGDLRRLVRQYRRDPESIYPTGPIGPLGEALNIRYGTSVVLPVPALEAESNRRYTGCIHLGA